jgi:hypothetical protein
VGLVLEKASLGCLNVWLLRTDIRTESQRCLSSLRSRIVRS